MKCEECLPLLELYADGELEPRAAANAGAHLEICVACARALRRLDEERDLFLSYECDAAPAPDFWDDVLTKVAAETASRPVANAPTPRQRARLAAAFGQFVAPRLSPALTAALLVCAVGATVALMKYAGTREEPSAREAAQVTAPRRVNEVGEAAERASPPMTGGEVASNDISSGETASEKATREEASDDRRRGAASRKSVERMLAREKTVGDAAAAGGGGRRSARRTPALLREESAPDRLVREAEQKYLAAIRLLARDVNRGRTRLDAGARVRFDETLAAVDRTIADTRRAAREHPRDPVAVQYMLTAYAKKVEVLREMARY